MAAKPSTPFAWATAGDRVTPSTDKILKGYVTRERPSAAGLNDHLFRIGEFTQYVFDGALVGDHSIDGALVTSGNTTVGGQPFTFTGFPFTADSTTDRIAHTAHGLETGDGPVHVTNTGGALPAPLVAGTDYYFIRIDADHGQLSNSRSNALGEFAIDITTNGTGTQTLLHQAGTTRVADAEITRNLKVDNNLRVDGNIFTFGTLGVNLDLTVGGVFRRPQRTITIPALPQQSNSGGSSAVPLVGPIDFWGLTLEAGTRILAARAVVDLDGGSPSWKLELVGNTLGSSLALGVLATSPNITTPGAQQTASLIATVDVLAGHSYGLQLHRNSAGNGIGLLACSGFEIDVIDTP